MFFKKIGAERKPAAFMPVYDFSGLEDKEFRKKVAQRIIEGTQIEIRSTGVAFIFGHSYADSETAICDLYPQLVIELNADGMATSGEPPSLRINAACEPSKDGQMTSAILIPFSELLNLQAKNGKLDLNSDQVTVTAQNLENEWPSDWYINKVNLINPKDSTDFIEVDAQNYRRTLGRSIVVHW